MKKRGRQPQLLFSQLRGCAWAGQEMEQSGQQMMQGVPWGLGTGSSMVIPRLLRHNGAIVRGMTPKKCTLYYLLLVHHDRDRIGARFLDIPPSAHGIQISRQINAPRISRQINGLRRVS